MYVSVAWCTHTRATQRAQACSHVRSRDSKFCDPTHVTGSKHEITNLELVNAEGRSGLIIALAHSHVRWLYRRHSWFPHENANDPCVSSTRAHCLRLITHVAWWSALIYAARVELYLSPWCYTRSFRFSGPIITGAFLCAGIAYATHVTCENHR